MRASQLHYENGKGYDVIDFISDYGLNFNTGNVVKYLSRAGKKPGNAELNLFKME